jgi:uncharacterized protein YceH (UPF0502 family)
LEQPLTPLELRVLGSLIEKEFVTPDQYPLSLNAVVQSCNQVSNREPVMQVNEQQAAAAIEHLRELSLVRGVQGIGARVMKYKQLAGSRWEMSPAELAILGVLLLRGPQTVGELRTRTQRVFDFPSVEAADAVLEDLARRNPPLVARLPRQPGQKESRHLHLLGDPLLLNEDNLEPVAATSRASNNSPRDDDDSRLARLESAVSDMCDDLANLREQLEAFRRQLE